MRLSPEQITQFRAEGWLALPVFWDEREVAAMRADLDRLKSNGKLRNVATDGDGKTTSSTKTNLQLCPMNPHSTLFRAMAFAPKVVETVSQLIGDPVLAHLDQVFLKPGRQGVGTNWHQDNAYFKISDPMKGTALWTAVHDATLANGCMSIIPGSFREEYEHSRDPDSDHHIRCYPPEDRAVPVELPAGGVLFFAYGTAHRTGGNNTDFERAGVALHFLNTNIDGPPHGGFALGDRPYLTGPNARGGEDVYGVRITGMWDAEVEKALQNDPQAMAPR